MVDRSFFSISPASHASSVATSTSKVVVHELCNAGLEVPPDMSVVEQLEGNQRAPRNEILPHQLIVRNNAAKPKTP